MVDPNKFIEPVDDTSTDVNQTEEGDAQPHALALLGGGVQLHNSSAPNQLNLHTRAVHGVAGHQNATPASSKLERLPRPTTFSLQSLEAFWNFTKTQWAPNLLIRPEAAAAAGSVQQAPGTVGVRHGHVLIHLPQHD